MYTFERTFDSQYIEKCMTSPSVWRMSIDDSLREVDPELFFVTDKVPMYFLKVHGYGLFVLEQRGEDVYEAHVALNEDARGVAVDICKEAIEWFFKNEYCTRIIASIPAFNHHALRLAKFCGFNVAGTRQDAFIKDGKSHDLRLFELIKE